MQLHILIGEVHVGVKVLFKTTAMRNRYRKAASPFVEGAGRDHRASYNGREVRVLAVLTTREKVHWGELRDEIGSIADERLCEPSDLKLDRGRFGSRTVKVYHEETLVLEQDVHTGTLKRHPN